MAIESLDAQKKKREIAKITKMTINLSHLSLGLMSVQISHLLDTR